MTAERDLLRLAEPYQAHPVKNLRIQPSAQPFMLLALARVMRRLHTSHHLSRRPRRDDRPNTLGGDITPRETYVDEAEDADGGEELRDPRRENTVVNEELPAPREMNKNMQELARWNPWRWDGCTWAEHGVRLGLAIALAALDEKDEEGYDLFSIGWFELAHVVREGTPGSPARRALDSSHKPLIPTLGGVPNSATSALSLTLRRSPRRRLRAYRRPPSQPRSGRSG
eukprot:2065831-Prymnesium_polylepis.1